METIEGVSNSNPKIKLEDNINETQRSNKEDSGEFSYR